MSIITSIDIGSISVRMLVARVEDKRLEPLYHDLQMTRLGKGVGKSKHLDDQAVQNTMNVLKRFERIACQYNTERIVAVATSAVRDAKNGRDFLCRINEETKIQARIIDGKEEADLTFRGAYHGLGFFDPVVLIDIGGGSTEIVGGDNEQISFLSSIDVGAVRATETFIKHDPAARDEITEMGDYISSLFGNSMVQKNIERYRYLVGVGGTITSMAAMAQSLHEYCRDKVHHFVLTRPRIDSIIYTLMELPLTEKRRIIGLQPERADIILAGSIILQKFMEQYHWDSVIVSESDILEGIILQCIMKTN